jgi:hypothetical protein
VLGTVHRGKAAKDGLLQSYAELKNACNFLSVPPIFLAYLGCKIDAVFTFYFNTVLPPGSWN